MGIFVTGCVYLYTGVLYIYIYILERKLETFVFLGVDKDSRFNFGRHVIA